jgi:uncharacterized protein
MYPEEYIEYLVHFHGDRDYFECHEILEEYWKEVDKNNKTSILVGFIQLAVSCYHHRRKNFKGAERTLQKAINILDTHKNELQHYGFSHKIFLPYLEERLEFIQGKNAYISMNLPIEDRELITLCKQVSKQKEMIWCQPSDLSNLELVHRHARRDRTDVIKEREEAISARQKKGRE